MEVEEKNLSISAGDWPTGCGGDGGAGEVFDGMAAWVAASPGGHKRGQGL